MSDKERALLQLCKDELVKTLTQMKDEIDFPAEPEDEKQRIGNRSHPLPLTLSVAAGSAFV
jgi:hypothetical protein